MEFLTYTPLLCLLAVIPLLVAGYKWSLVDRPQALKSSSFLCRLAAVVLLVLALCRPFINHRADGLHVVFLLDVSESVEPAEMRRGLDEIRRAKEALHSGDTSSLFLFAKGLRPVTPEDAGKFIADCEQGRGDADFRSATDIESALSTARLALPGDKGRRIVVLSDGASETSVSGIVARLASEQTDLRFARLKSIAHPEAAVVAIESGAPMAFEGEVVRFKVRLASNKEMPAKLRITHRGVAVAEQDVTLAATGETICHADIKMVTGGDTVWEAEVIPQDDWFPVNNRASVTLPVRGRPRVLVLHDKPALMRPAERLLREQDIELETRGVRGLPDTFDAILSFDAIILADVTATALTPKQMGWLKRYVTDFGGGLIMMGSENSFGLGGYYRTPVEEVLPLISRFEKDKEKPSLAMVLVVDKSGSMEGTPMELARQAARAAAELLGGQDQIAVIGFDDQAQLVCDLTPASNRASVAAAIDSLQASGGTNLQPAMVQARDILRGASARLKHVIAMTDGQTDPSNLVELSREMADSGMTVSTVAMGESAAGGLLEEMAGAGGGRYYQTDSPENVPQIFTRETMQASRSAIKEDLYGAATVTEHPLLAGFERTEFPPVLGYVMAKPKPTAQVLLATETGDPLLAIARFGLGTGIAFTADLTERWGGEWLAWDGCGKFWAQALRAVLRKEDAVGIETRIRDDRGRMIIDVNRTDEAGKPLDRVRWNASALDDAGKEQPVSSEETGVGKYRFTIPVADSPRLTIRLTDTDEGKVKTLRWNRSYPAEYQLTANAEKSLADATGFDPARIREGIQPVRIRTNALPWFGLAAIALMLGGGVLRRI
ncbi:MAG: VWA domain-containing protein [Verrucomicrobiota bacterium]